MFSCRTILLVFLASSFIPFASADTPNSALGQVSFSAYGSTNKSEEGLFTTDFIVPLYYTSSKDTLFYYNPKDTYTTPDANEIHQGVGLRHIFDDSYILGINTFFDRRQDHSDAWFSQAGVGLEYLSHPLDMRLNWYKPTTRYKVLSEEGGSGAGTYEFTNTSLVELTGAGQEVIEEPMQGLDFEVGVPVFDKYTKTRVYLGGYFYQPRLSKDVNGFRARTETGITKWLSLDTTFNSNIGKKEEFYGGLRVTLSFDLSNLFNRTGKPIFSAPAISNSKNTYLEDRIFDRVVRDIDIQSKTVTKGSGGSGSQTVQDLIYVNNVTGSDSGLGTRLSPYKTITEGVAAAVGGKWVYVEGQGASNYTGGLTLTNSVVLWGSGYNGGFYGLAVSGAYPVINGGANGITLANNNTVMGFTIQGATSNGIIFQDGTTLSGTIKYNYFTGYGIYLGSNTGAMSNFTISNNVFTGTGGQIDLSDNVGTMTNFTISNNTITPGNAGSDAINLEYNGNNGENPDATMSNFTISNNVITGGDHPINLYGNSGILNNFTIFNNTITNAGDGINLSYNSYYGIGTMTGFTISNNILTGNLGSGIDLSDNGYYGTGQMTDFTISNNTITGSHQDGINMSDNGYHGTGTMTDITISYNTLTNNTYDGINMSFNNEAGIAGTMTNFIISNNMITGNQHDGIDLSYNGYNNGDSDGTGTMTGFTISNNTLTGNHYDGLDLSENGYEGRGEMDSFTISHNSLSENLWSGMDLSYNGDNYGNGTMNGFILSNNIVANNENNGIDLTMNGNDNSTGTITNFTFSYNTVTGNSEDGIYFSNSSGGSMSAINLGNGTTGGYNSLYGQDDYQNDLYNGSGINNLSAEYNWWGQAGGPIANQIVGPDSVDSTHPLSANPN